MLHIDKELHRAPIGDLPPETLAELERAIKREGCRDPIVVWKDHDIILDGCNRYTICEKAGIGYRTVSIDLPDRDAARGWILAAQYGRRNWNAEQRGIALGELLMLRKKAAGANLPKPPDGEKTGEKPNDLLKRKNCALGGKTAAAIAQEHGVATRTVELGEELLLAVNALAEAAPDLPAQLAAHKGPKRKTIIEAAKHADDPEKAKAILAGTPEPEKSTSPTDHFGNPLPKNLIEVFSRRNELAKMMTTLSLIKTTITRGCESHDPLYLHVTKTQMEGSLGQARSHLRFASPYAVCPYCRGSGGIGKNCKLCKGNGWLGVYAYGLVATELKYVEPK